MNDRDAILLRRRLLLQAALVGAVACDKEPDTPPPMVCLSPPAPPCPSARGLIAFADTSVTLGEPQRAELHAYASEALPMNTRIYLAPHISALPLPEGDAARLSQARTAAVQAELLSAGFPETRLIIAPAPIVIPAESWSAPGPPTPGAGYIQLSCEY